MEERKTYKCSICGKEHPSVCDRANCELACWKVHEELAKQAAEKKKKAEEIASTAAVTKALDEAYDLLQQHIKQYGNFKYDGKVGEL